MGTQVTAVRTPTTAAQAAALMASLWASTIGGTPNNYSLAVLTTQIDVETAWNSIWNFNYGNLKPSGGSDYLIISGITLRAFSTPEDGMTAFLNLLKLRYGAALASAAQGDLAGYAANLKAVGYYVEPESDYLAVLQSRYPKNAAVVNAGLPLNEPSSKPNSTWLFALLGGLTLGGAAFYISEHPNFVKVFTPAPVRRRRQYRRAYA